MSTKSNAESAAAARRAAERGGALAEALCRWLLRLKGYRIVAARLRTRVGEIDIVASRGRTLVFAEVKARPDLATARAAVTARQRIRLARAAAWFLKGHPHYAGHSVRFDLLAVAPGRFPLHIPDAWQVGPQSGRG